LILFASIRSDLPTKTGCSEYLQAELQSSMTSIIRAATFLSTLQRCYLIDLDILFETLENLFKPYAYWNKEEILTQCFSHKKDISLTVLLAHYMLYQASIILPIQNESVAA